MNLHGLPPKFEIVVPPSRSYDHTGALTASQLEQQVSALMDATNMSVAACAALAPSDVTAWQGVYASWKAFDKAYKDCTSGSAFLNPLECFQLGMAGDVATQLGVFQQTAQQWQARVAAACPSIQPTPIPSPAPAPTSPQQPGCGFVDTLLGRCAQTPCGWWDSMLGRCQQPQPVDTGTSWASAVKWVAILGVIGVAAWYLGPFIATAAGALTAGAGKVKRRIESGAPEGAEYAGFSFGDMSVEAPKITSLDFGDISKDAVLDILKKGGA